ncbi:hypothetical protein WB401_28665 [Streptomyces brasiliscabiei]|uniref:Uncharacterized protein n=1 Tax=Streptomyces brasiliscabiei TaxID=2736302 RepID=A0ABU8GLV3_9ACTN
MPSRTALSRRIRKAGAAVRAGLFLVLALIALTVPTSYCRQTRWRMAAY